MKNIIGVLAAIALLVGVNGKPHSGSCILNQCFAVFHDSADFATAQQQCEEQSGHLMTVQSSPYNDMIHLLLGSLEGHFWIGLHLPSGHCPNNAYSLRGYQWVTGSNASDFQNWGAYDELCSPKCISVSHVDLFHWTEQSCDSKLAGFVCEYNFQFSCKPLNVNSAESVEYTTPIGFKGEDLASFPSGTTAVQKPYETKFICYSEEWIQAPWHCEIAEGGCEYRCLSVNQKPVCICPPGQILNGNNVTCEEAKNDPCLLFGCEHECYHKNISHASCVCLHGFQLAEDGKACRDVDECVDDRQCPDNTDCMNTIGGFECNCLSGYTRKNDICVDIDECKQFPCEHICSNTEGSYTCSCYDGYILTAQSPYICKLHCPREECPAECDPNDPSQCNCPDGFVSDERNSQTYCVDINECDMYACDQQCKNTYGGYACSCSDGYELVDGYRCVEDEVTDEGSGFTTPFEFLTPTVTYPTLRPSVVTAGGLLAIIVCIVIVVLVIVFLAHILMGRGKQRPTAGALDTKSEDLHEVMTYKHENASSERSLKQDT